MSSLSSSSQNQHTQVLGTPVLKSQEGLAGPCSEQPPCLSPDSQISGCCLSTCPPSVCPAGPGRPGAQLAQPTTGSEGPETASGGQAPAPPHSAPLTSVKHVLSSLELLAFSPCSCGREGTSELSLSCYSEEAHLPWPCHLLWMS